MTQMHKYPPAIDVKVDRSVWPEWTDLATQDVMRQMGASLDDVIKQKMLEVMGVGLNMDEAPTSTTAADIFAKVADLDRRVRAREHHNEIAYSGVDGFGEF